MALTIFWSRRADSKFDAIAQYLNENWGEASAKQFAVKVYNLLDILVKFPEIGAIQDKNKGIRGILIVEQVTLFYKVQDKQVILLNFFTNYQNPINKF